MERLRAIFHSPFRPLQSIDIAPADQASGLTTMIEQADDDIGSAMRHIAVELAIVSREAMGVENGCLGVVLVDPFSVLGPRIDGIAMLIDTILPVAACNEFAIVAVSLTPRDERYSQRLPAGP